MGLRDKWEKKFSNIFILFSIAKYATEVRRDHIQREIKSLFFEMLVLKTKTISHLRNGP